MWSNYETDFGHFHGKILFTTVFYQEVTTGGPHAESLHRLVGLWYVHTSQCGVFTIFTIIINDTYQIITLKMTSTTIPAERSLTYTFTTIAHVASHAGMTR